MRKRSTRELIAEMTALNDVVVKRNAGIIRKLLEDARRLEGEVDTQPGQKQHDQALKDH